MTSPTLRVFSFCVLFVIASCRSTTPQPGTPPATQPPSPTKPAPAETPIASSDELAPVLALGRGAHSDEVAKELAIAEWRVTETVLGKQRQLDYPTRQAARIVKYDGICYVKEKDTPRWMVGQEHGERRIHCDHGYADLPALVDAVKFNPLPTPPAGLALREVARLPYSPTRLASDGQGKVLYVLCVNGDVWRIDLVTGKTTPLFYGENYIDFAQGTERFCVGMTLAPDGRCYIAVNQKIANSSPLTNQVTIFRSDPRGDGDPARPKPWVRAYYPWGIGPYNHGVGHLAIGPDGMLYANSGSRTDADQPGDDDRYWKGGEHFLTSCIWRLDPKQENPQIEIYAKGLRNAYGFCFDSVARMWATDNGPDKDPAEELNLIERGGHYGFPYEFSDWKNKPYPTTPDAPPGLTFSRPVINLGPDGAMKDGKPMSTFTPHSSPSGIVYLGDEWPEPYRGGFFVARFGDLIATPWNCGFDLLHMRVTQNADGSITAQTNTVLAPIARPVDIHLGDKGKLYICEYSRQTRNAGFSGMLPGRVLELSVVGN